MRWTWSRNRRDPLPEPAAAVVGRDRVLAWAVDGLTGRTLVVGERAMYAVPPASVADLAGASSDSETSRQTRTSRGRGASSVRGAVGIPGAPQADPNGGWTRAWHLVDGGSFDRESSTLKVTWVDGSPAEAWRLPLDSDLPELFRARVQATVVLADQVDLGPGRRAKVVIRKDLTDQSLVPQVVLGRGIGGGDPELDAAARAALGRLKEQVGLA